MALLKRTSSLSGQTNEREIPVEADRLRSYFARREAGKTKPIQIEFPELSADDREFIISGITPDEWEGAFGEGSDPRKQVGAYARARPDTQIIIVDSPEAPDGQA
jgi:hypothetical protein